MSSEQQKKPLVLSTMPVDQLLVERLRDVANIQSRQGFVSVRETQLCEEDYANMVIIIASHLAKIDKDFLDRCHKLRAVIKYGIGVDNIDVQYAATVGVCVCNIPDYGVEEVADSAFSHLLNLFRQTTLFHNLLQSGKHFTELSTVGKAVRRVRGKTLGLIGVGNIGTAVAERAKAFGFKVIFFDPYVPIGFDKAHGVERLESVEDVVKRSDCVSLHCALTPQTKHIISESVLRMFKREAFLINVSRGALVDESALAEALKEGRIAGAGIDVFVNEPFSLKRSVYENVPNLFLTPHVAWYSPESVEDLRDSCVKYVRYTVTHSDPSGLHSCLNRRELDLESSNERWRD